ncbi:hypothetical protein [Mycolicibacterium neoaurum]|nr:hypothetical protein [Mycolicibacterium neoaurum]WBP96194.1 hypothetical protein O7W24_08525 [Mycolicibacterium neoaurum]
MAATNVDGSDSSRSSSSVNWADVQDRYTRATTKTGGLIFG